MTDHSSTPPSHIARGLLQYLTLLPWRPRYTFANAPPVDLERYYGEVGRTFDASPYADDQFIFDIATRSAIDAVRASPHALPQEFLQQLSQVLLDLLRDEVFAYFPEVDFAEGLTAEARGQLRYYLDHKQRFLAQPDAHLAPWRETVTSLLIELIAQIPTALCSAGESEEPLFTTNIGHMITEPAAIVETITVALGAPHLIEAHLFEVFRQRLEYNSYAASGIAYEERHATKRAPKKPSESKLASDKLAATYLGGTPFVDFLDIAVPIAIPEKAWFEHCHILGGTGHGKSQTIQKLLHHHLREAQASKRSIVVIDSQGDLIRNISRLDVFDPDVSGSLPDRFLLIDPSDIDHPPALNLFDPGLERLENYTPRERELTFNSVVDIYGRFFGSLLGSELTSRQSSVFRYIARLMLTIEGATIHTLIELMDDIRPFAAHVEKLDETARRFFEKEFSRKSFNGTRNQIKDRLYAVLSIPTFDRLFSAPKSKIDLFTAMNNGSVILVNTAKDLLKEDGASIFGRFILSLIEHAIMERATLNPADRTPTFLYVDEAQDYFDETVETLLVQGRKYNFGLVLAHQNLAQLETRLSAIIMGNTTIKLAGGVSDSDARALSADMRTTPEMLLSMQKRQDVTQFALSVRNVTSHALAVDIPLGFIEEKPRLSREQHEALLERNRERCCRTPEEIEASTDDVASGEEAIPMPDLSSEVPEPAAPPPTSAPEPGQGHRDLQTRIRQAAQRCGFSADIEKPVDGGKGRIDVALARDGMRIAVEVSVTTRPEQERHNIEKCLAAGYGEVWVTSPDAVQLDKLRASLQAGLSAAVQERVSFLLEDALIARLDALAMPSSFSRSTVLGYEVEVMHTTVRPPQAKDRRDRLAAVLSGARRPTNRGG